MEHAPPKLDIALVDLHQPGTLRASPKWVYPPLEVIGKGEPDSNQSVPLNLTQKFHVARDNFLSQGQSTYNKLFPATGHHTVQQICLFWLELMPFLVWTIKSYFAQFQHFLHNWIFFHNFNYCCTVLIIFSVLFDSFFNRCIFCLAATKKCPRMPKKPYISCLFIYLSVTSFIPLNLTCVFLTVVLGGGEEPDPGRMCSTASVCHWKVGLGLLYYILQRKTKHMTLC